MRRGRHRKTDASVDRPAACTAPLVLLSRRLYAKTITRTKRLRLDGRLSHESVEIETAPCATRAIGKQRTGAEVEGIAAENAEAVTCRKCLARMARPRGAR
jgi:hypothetical protein